MAGGNAHMVLSFNPNTRRGEAYECMHSRRKLYHCIRISAFDTPNWIAGENIINGMITRKRAEEWIETYGWESNFVRVKVRGLYPREDDDAVLPIEWIELAMQREAPTGPHVMGVDPAGEGTNEIIFARRNGWRHLPLIAIAKAKPMKVAERTKTESMTFKAIKTVMDAVGIGDGIHDRARQLQVPGLVAFKSNRASRKPKKYHNLGSEAWWMFREALDPDGDNPISLPYDLELMAQLSAAKWTTDGQDRIWVIPKKEWAADDESEMEQESPDRAEATILANFGAATAKPIASGGTNVTHQKKNVGGGMRRLSDRFNLRRRS